MTEITGSIKDLAIDFKSGKAVLTLAINEKQDAMRLYDDLNEAEKLSIRIGRYREKRSLNANKYAWALISALGENQGAPKEEIYRRYIQEMGVCRQVEIDEKAADTLIHSWGLHGLGWIAEKLDYAKNAGFVLIDLHYGSSTYNTKQMSRFIDYIVQDCKAVGINTKTPDEIADLISLWGEEFEKHHTGG